MARIAASWVPMQGVQPIPKAAPTAAAPAGPCGAAGAGSFQLLRISDAAGSSISTPIAITSAPATSSSPRWWSRNCAPSTPTPAPASVNTAVKPATNPAAASVTRRRWSPSCAAGTPLTNDR